MNTKEQIKALKKKRELLSDETEIQAINDEIEILKSHLGKIDRRVEKIKIKRNETEDLKIKHLLRMRKYTMLLDKHMTHLIESYEDELNDRERQNLHFHRCESRIKHLLEMINEFEGYRNDSQTSD